MNLFKKFFLVLLLATTSFVTNAQSNSSNPYDYVGLLHNNGLESFFKDYTKDRVETESLTEAQLYNYLFGVYELSENDIEYMTTLINDPLYAEIKGKSLLECGEYLLVEGFLSQTAVDYLSQIDEVMESYYDGEYEDFYSQIVSLETQINDDESLTEREKTCLLIGTSTARYSVKYWKDNFDSIEEQGGTAYSNKTLPLEYTGLVENFTPEYFQSVYKMNSFWGRGKAIAGADVAGAVSGAAMGAVTGSITLPVVGTVSGWIGGGVVGGGGASIYEAVSQLWNWLF